MPSLLVETGGRMMTREINWLAQTYLDEVEKLEYWEFTKNLLGRVA